MKVLLFPLLATLSFATDVIFKSDIPQYSASYSVDTTNPIYSEFHVQLELLNYNITNWTLTNGGEGVFMGIGLGT